MEDIHSTVVQWPAKYPNLHTIVYNRENDYTLDCTLSLE